MANIPRTGTVHVSEATGETEIRDPNPAARCGAEGAEGDADAERAVEGGGGTHQPCDPSAHARRATAEGTVTNSKPLRLGGGGSTTKQRAFFPQFTLTRKRLAQFQRPGRHRFQGKNVYFGINVTRLSKAISLIPSGCEQESQKRGEIWSHRCGKQGSTLKRWR